MEESQNHVIKDCHNKVKKMNDRVMDLERTDFDDKFNHITRRMISDVVRELLTPIQLSLNLEQKAIKKIIEEHAAVME